MTTKLVELSSSEHFVPLVAMANYANDYNAYMLDEYGLPSYSSRRSSYNYAFSDQIPQPSNVYPSDLGRKLSTASDRSTATKTLDLPSSRDELSRQNSTISWVSDKFHNRSNQICQCCGKKLQNTLTAIVLLCGCVIMVLGICLLVFANDDHNKEETALGPLGCFFLTLGILIAMLTLSILFLPNQSNEPRPKQYSGNLPRMNMQNEAQRPQTISSLHLDPPTNLENPTPGMPKITITRDKNMHQFPMTRQTNF